MQKTYSIREIEERLEFYYSKLYALDEEQKEDLSSINYLKEQISHWKKEHLQAEENKLFGENIVNSSLRE
ncbi:hypothetical protein SynWH8101_0054 [Synechococcus sp. WH 8101]|nr:hypothetical protein SynWH8101_0054 [Synechococcus sp. WH 8101]QNI43866.1 hypothetical protein SynRCC2555_00056 [Synechococcus sp. WH 8101]